MKKSTEKVLRTLLGEDDTVRPDQIETVIAVLTDREDWFEEKYKLPTLVTYNFANTPAAGDDWSDGAVSPGGDFDITASTVNRKLVHITTEEASQKKVVGIILAAHANIWGNN